MPLKRFSPEFGYRIVPGIETRFEVRNGDGNREGVDTPVVSRGHYGENPQNRRPTTRSPRSTGDPRLRGAEHRARDRAVGLRVTVERRRDTRQATMKTIKTNDDRPRGQVGIGTLIIFIAMVLVAAVAAGVLVNTSGLLQSKAEDTGADAQAQVSNQIDVVSATGTISGSSVNEVVLVVKKSPGSDPIDLAEATIEYTSASDSVTMTQGSGFSVAAVSGTGMSGTVLDDNGERAKLTLTLDGASGNPGNLGEGGSATLEIVDQSGASTVYGVNVPDVLTGQSYVEV
jgi:flagellin-like protein